MATALAAPKETSTLDDRGIVAALASTVEVDGIERVTRAAVLSIWNVGSFHTNLIIRDILFLGARNTHNTLYFAAPILAQQLHVIPRLYILCDDHALNHGPLSGEPTWVSTDRVSASLEAGWECALRLFALEPDIEERFLSHPDDLIFGVIEGVKVWVAPQLIEQFLHFHRQNIEYFRKYHSTEPRFTNPKGK